MIPAIPTPPAALTEKPRVPPTSAFSNLKMNTSCVRFDDSIRRCFLLALEGTELAGISGVSNYVKNGDNFRTSSARRFNFWTFSFTRSFIDSSGDAVSTFGSPFDSVDPLAAASSSFIFWRIFAFIRVTHDGCWEDFGDDDCAISFTGSFGTETPFDC